MRYLTAMAVVLFFVQSCYAIGFQELLESYDVLETVAGTGLIPDKGLNGWTDDMEGGDAVDAELSRPHITMADEVGNLYIADKDAHAVRIVTVDGTIHTVAGTNFAGYNGDGVGVETELNAPNGLYTFPDGTTYILDLGNSLIRRLGTDGEITTVIDDPFGIQVGRGLWVSPDQTTIFYASGSEVRQWTEDEGVTVYASGFVALGNLAVDPSDGNVVATDRGGHAVYKVFPDGSKQLIAGNRTTNGGGSGRPALSTGLDEVRGIYFHPEGGYFLATHDGGQVWFVDDDNMIHLLIDGDDDGTHAGDGLPLSSPGRKVSEVRAVTLSPRGDLIITEHDAGFVRLVRSNRVVDLGGDFNQNGSLDADDMDLLSQEVNGDADDLVFDVNSDGLIDEADRAEWVNVLMNTYFGDSNLDGEFNSGDLVTVFLAGEYQDGIDGKSGWAHGDWNGDGDFDSGDFVVAFTSGGYETGPRPKAAAVPEPGALAWMLFAGFVFGIIRRHHAG